MGNNQYENDMKFLQLKESARGRERVGSKAGGGKEPTCMGLVTEMCKPCPRGGPKGFCTAVLSVCRRLFCSPMCRRNTWKCAVEFGALAKEAADPTYEKALCAQFIAHGCSSVMDCCKDDRLLYDYVENYAYFGSYPNPRFPTPSCIQGPNADLCAKCKANVKVKVEAQVAPNRCPYPQPEGEDTAEEKKTHSIAKDQAGFAYPGVNEHKGLQERCLKLEAKVKAKIAPMKTAFQENVCKCMVRKWWRGKW